MDDLREKLERALAEHQQESDLHMIGGREKLMQRLLKVLASSPDGPQASEGTFTARNGPCC